MMLTLCLLIGILYRLTLLILPLVPSRRTAGRVDTLPRHPQSFGPSY